MAFAYIRKAYLWYEDRGNRGEATVLHHGHTASEENLKVLGSLLEKQHRLITMESRGVGRSQHSRYGYSLHSHAHDIIKLMDYLKIYRFNYIGHSMGGGLGFLLAINFPERVKRLILLAPIPSSGYRAEKGFARKRDIFRLNKNILALKKLLRQRATFSYKQKESWFFQRAKTICSSSNGHYFGVAKEMAQFNISHDLKNIATPTLFMCGKKDPLLKKNMADKYLMPLSKMVVIENAGHDIAIEQPAKLSKIIANFIQ